MKKKLLRGWRMLAIIVLIVVIANSALYIIIKSTYDRKISSIVLHVNSLGSRMEQKTDELSEKIDDSTRNLLDMIDEEGERTDTQRRLLENQTLENFRKLESYINDETSILRLNLESRLQDVDVKVGSLEKKSTELEEKVDTINVRSSDFSKIATEVARAVVSIRTQSGQGSGVFVDKRGYVLTNRHVVEDAEFISLVDYDSARYSARIVAVAEGADLALLKAEINTTPYLLFEPIENVRVGQRVIAVGSPLGLSFTVTEGIVSSLGRRIDNTGIGYIQTDVSINKGNSGGPLVSTSKKIVGINTYKISAGEGLGFATPSDIAKEFTDLALAQT
ncbi:MAG: trypsin-like peptidase domain-containing protein [Candidatus Woesearchaeota archaeon]